MGPFDVVISVVLRWLEGFVALATIIVRATPDWFGATFDILVRATPDFGDWFLPMAAVAIVTIGYLLWESE